MDRTLNKLWMAVLILTYFSVLICSQYHYDYDATAGQVPWNTENNDYYYESLQPEDDLPSLTQPDETQLYATQGDDMILPCVVHNLGDFNLTWRRRDQILWVLQEKPEGPFVSDVMKDPRIDRAGTSLSISSVQAGDAGPYTCEVDSHPPSQITYTLDIRVPPSIIPANNRSIVSVVQGHSITLACEAFGNPTPTITWSRMNGRLTGNTNGPNLTVTKVTPAQNQWVFRCAADNGYGKTATADITLQVFFAPIIRAESSIVYAGVDYDANLVCVVEGGPDPKLNWFHAGGRPVNPMRLNKAVGPKNRYSLQFASVRKDDFGVYTCNGTNFLGNASAVISLMGHPKPVRYHSSPQGDKDTSYTLVWHVQSYSPVITYNIAYKNDSDVEDQWVNFTVPGTTSASPYHASSHTFTQLEPGATYHVQVTAINEYGIGDINQTFSFTTFNPGESSSEVFARADKNGTDDGTEDSGNLLEQEQPISVHKLSGEESSAAAAQDGGGSGAAGLNLTPAQKRTQMIAFVTAIILSCFF